VADRKISDLTALTAQASGDLLPIVDVSEAAAADKNKSITVEELFRGIPVNVGVGVASPSSNLHVKSSAGAGIRIQAGSTSDAQIDLIPGGTSDPYYIYVNNSRNLIFQDFATERARIDSSGRLLVGTTTNSSPGGFNAKIQIADTSYTGSLSLRRDSNNNAAQSIIFGKSRGALNGNTIVQDDDILGYVSWFGADGTDLNSEAARISAHVDGTPGENDMPGRLVFSTTADGQQAPTERMRITSAGQVGIGKTSSFAYKLEVEAGNTSLLRLNNNTETGHGSHDVRIVTGGSYYQNLQFRSSSIQFETYDGSTISERARIDSSGRLLVGTSSGSGDGILIVQGGAGTPTADAVVTLRRGSNNPGSGIQALGQIRFEDLSGGYGAQIAAISDGSWNTSTDCPTALKFATTADGASSPTEAARIDSNGTFAVGQGTGAGSAGTIGFFAQKDGAFGGKRSGNNVLFVNRGTNDGNLVQLYQGDVQEGSISVSGSTVSYNGAHLARWSQLPGGVERTEILRGSVLSNIDEMCDWGEEENEQLNRMKVSDVEGDRNVAGVFQAWDDDDDTYTNDFYCAMTGDFIIRIAQGVTVERGDLLMSAGDGTAKPQDDDIIRSKTIAKVTSTNVSCTYDDGSYCVPCVLMAC